MLFSKKSRAAKFRGQSAAADCGFIRFSAVLQNGTGDRRIRPSAITETAARYAGRRIFVRAPERAARQTARGLIFPPPLCIFLYI